MGVVSLCCIISLAMSMSSIEPTQRRSRRLRGLQSEPLQGKRERELAPIEKLRNQDASRPKKRKTPSARGTSKTNGMDTKSVLKKDCLSLPRLREGQILKESPHIHYVIGIDEAGRGPLAGPVVAAAIHLKDPCIPGIIDSKKIGEDKREELFDRIVNTSSAVWAVAVIDAAKIDEINILQATLLGMRVAAEATIQDQDISLPIRAEASVKEKGCYVLHSKNQLHVNSNQVHALIDGNRLPGDMEFCPKECMVKGDGREYSIAAASILAKVTRDRLMRKYGKMYPEYNFEQHKGYGTAAHVKAIAKHGASPIHRMTFAPLKHMHTETK